MSFSLHLPETVEAAIAAQVETGGRYLAGGTVLLVNRHRGQDIGGDLVSLERVTSLRRIALTGNSLEIGSGVTFDAIEHSDLVREHAFALWQAACEVGGPQIRHRATLGGNLAAASPSADAAPPLLALNASVRVQGQQGERLMPLDGFFKGRLQTALAPDELITAVVIPLDGHPVSRFAKVGKRSALAVSCINMALARLDDGTIRVAVGAAAPEARLCRETSRLLSQSPEAVEDAKALILTEISPIDDRWATASYRNLVCRNLLGELLSQIKEVIK